MGLSTLFAERAANDTARISRAGVNAAISVSGKIRNRALTEYRKGGNVKGISEFIVTNLQDVLTNTLLAGHLAGFRRVFLIRSQLPSLKKRQDTRNQRIALSGARSVLDDTLEVLQARTGMDLDALQQQYNTQALKVLNNVGQSVERDLSDTITTLIADGAHVKEGIETLNNKFNALGLTPRKPFELETVFRTQLQLAFGAGKYQAEQDPAVQEILWGYKYVTVGDDRVRENHAAVEGVTLPKGDPFWQRFYPPNGYNCRCQAIPIFEERQPVQPPPTLSDGSTPVEPDKGFAFNPGEVFKARPAHIVELPKTVTATKPVADHLQGTPDGAKKVAEDIATVQTKYEKEIERIKKRAETRDARLEKIQTQIESTNQQYMDAKQLYYEKQQAYENMQEIAAGTLKLDNMSPEVSQQIGQTLLASSKEEYEAAKAAAMKLDEERTALRQERDSIIDDDRKYALKQLAEPKERQTDFTVADEAKTKAFVESLNASPSFGSDGPRVASKEQVKLAKEVTKAIGPVMNKDVWEKRRVAGKDSDVSVIDTEKNFRAYASFGSIFMNSKCDIRVYAHELGHCLDNNARTYMGGVKNPVSQACHDFIQHRCGSEPLTVLHDKYPQHGFKPEEAGRKDRFDEVANAFERGESTAYYTGKTYSDKQSEVLSMGLEYFYLDPVKFAKTDPEYFAFVVGVLKGDIGQ
jgi:SPP1 gp7 family putative phage head morphogenesis protein